MAMASQNYLLQVFLFHFHLPTNKNKKIDEIQTKQNIYEQI